MFTGIIQGIAKIKKIKEKKNFRTHIIKLPKNMVSNLKLGSSLSNNGCCLTVSNIKKNLVSVDIIKETLNKTNLGHLNIGDKINIEKSMNLKDQIGGHIMSGHITTTAKIIKIFQSINNYVICFILKDFNFMKFVFYKGFIGIDGISLTVNKIYKNTFYVSLIPTTLLLTTIGLKKVGQYVNVEIDFQTQIIVESVERFLKKYFFNS